MELNFLFEKAYRKLKSYVYYDNTNLFLKAELASFDSALQKDIDYFQHLADTYRFNDHNSYFEDITTNIGVYCLPKSFHPSNSGIDKNSNLISNKDLDTTYKVEQYTYISRVPIEAQILCVAWILTIGEKLDKNLIPNVYGNRLKSFIRNDIEKTRCTPHLFEAYHTQYEQWRDNAITAARNCFNNGSNALIVALDIQNYYYSARIDFSSLKKYIEEQIIKDDKELLEFSPLTDLVEIIFKKYSALFKYNNPEQGYMIPIGFLPAHIISNWYLDNFDKQVLNRLRPLYYGRYVDDMLFVINVNDEVDNINQIDLERCDNRIWKFIINKYFFAQTDSGLLSLLDPEKDKDLIEKNSRKDDEGSKPEYKLIVNNTPLLIQNKKIKLYYLEKKSSQAILDNFEREIAKNVSEFRFLTEKNVLLDSFDDTVYNIRYSDSINKLRSIDKVEINKYALSKYLAKVIYSSKFDNKDEEKKIIASINILMSDINCIKLYQYWEKIISYYFVQGNYVGIESLIKKLTEFITYKSGCFICIDSDSLRYSLKSDEESKETQKQLIQWLMLAVSRVFALGNTLSISISLNNIINTFEANKEIKTLLGELYPSIQECIQQTRQDFFNSYMVNNQLISWPLLNLFISNEKINFADVSFIKYIGIIGEDLNKISNYEELLSHMHLPRFIHLHECILFQVYSDIFVNKSDDYLKNSCKVLDKAFDLFTLINYGFSQNIDNKQHESKLLKKENYFLIDNKDKPDSDEPFNRITVGDHINKKINIAIANIEVKLDYDSKRIIGKPVLDSKRSNRLFKLINLATKAKEKVDLFVMPEFYIPIEWLPLLAEQSRKHNMAIITGIEHVVVDQNAYNFIATILPVKIDDYTNAVVKLRLKRHLAPLERETLEGYRLNAIEGNKEHYKYDLFNWNGVRIAPYYCFEIADIKDRAIFKSYADIIVASEYNKDVPYFSNIIESLSRDLHCYCVQVNTSNYGDSRIVKPSKYELMNIIKVKGGLNDTILIGEVDVQKLNEFQIKEYALQKGDESFKTTPPNMNKDEILRRVRE